MTRPENHARNGFLARLVCALPDALTLGRLLLSLTILALILLRVREPGLATILYLVAWTTDIIDGKIARAMGIEGRMGKWDFPVDAFLAWAGAAYLAYLGFIHPGFFWGWTAIWALLAILTRNQAVVMLTEFAGIVACGVGMFSNARMWFWVCVAWIGLMLALDAPRFIAVVRGFIVNAADFILPKRAQR